MSYPAVVVVALVGAACGARSSGTVGDGRRGATGGPVLVFVGLDRNMMFEAACHAPASGPDCDAQRRAALDGTQHVTSGGARFRITGTVSDDCDASGPNDVVGLERVTGGEEDYPGIVTYPDRAPIDLQTHESAELGADSKGIAIAADVRAALARLATSQVKGQDDPRAIGADEIVVEQLVTTNVDGSPDPDVLISANVPLVDDPGYRWSALILLPGGDVAAATSLWTSTLEHLWLDATFDLDGDGRRELIYGVAYYEGSGRGAAAIRSGKLEMLGQWGCGA